MRTSRLSILTLALCLAAAGPAQAAQALLRSPLLAAPATPVKNAFVSLALRLEGTPGGQASLARLPELSRLSRLNVEGFWGAGTLELLLRRAPELSLVAAAAVRNDTPEAKLRELDEALGRARRDAAEDVRRISAAVEADLAATEYGIDDLHELGFRVDELAGLAVIDGSAASAMAAVQRRFARLNTERTRRVEEFLRRGAQALGSSPEEQLIARMGEAVVAARPEMARYAPGLGQGVRESVEYLERRGRLPTLRKVDYTTGEGLYPPRRPIDEPEYFKAKLSLEGPMLSAALGAQAIVMQVAAEALRQALPRFAASLFGMSPGLAPHSFLSMALALEARLTIQFWSQLAEEMAGLNANGQEAKDALLAQIKNDHRFKKDGPATQEQVARNREVFAALGEMIESLPRAVLEYRLRAYAELKRAQGLLAYPSKER